MIFKIILKNIVHKKLSSLLSILLMAFGILIISLVLQVTKQLEERFSKNLSGIDMVVGAKGSPLQLILSGVFQIDNPTGNVKLSEINALINNALVKELIPLAMGDNHGGFRIVGTNGSYIKHFKVEIKEGKIELGNNEVIIGANVNKLLKLNTSFESAHGLDKDGEKHAENAFKVVGVLKQSNTVLDNLIITNLETIWAVHEHEEEPSKHDEAAHGESAEKEITCALVKFRSPLGMMTIPRNINTDTKMMAAMPAIEVNRLFELLGVGLQSIKYLALAIMLISGFSVFIALYNALKERKYEIALMLSMGAKRTALFLMLLGEGLILCISGFVLGIVLSRLAFLLLKIKYEANLGSLLNSSVLLKEEIYLLGGALLVGIFAALIPSIGIYRLNISKTLAKDA
jgi:putative ABC transport system permease protein